MSFIPEIKKDIEEWRLIDITLTGNTNDNILFIANKLQLYFKDYNINGKIFICSTQKLLALPHTGKKVLSSRLKKEITAQMPEHSCSIIASEVSTEAIQNLLVRIKDIEIDVVEKKKPLVDKRNVRKENVIMVADDDMLTRAMVTRAFKDHTKIVVVENGKSLLDSYLTNLPDVLFLDIHLPDVNGINLLNEVVKYDNKAYIIMLSADSNSNNVMWSNFSGAKGFITKPFTEEILLDFFNRCPTIIKPITEIEKQKTNPY